MRVKHHLAWRIGGLVAVSLVWAVGFVLVTGSSSPSFIGMFVLFALWWGVIGLIKPEDDREDGDAA